MNPTVALTPPGNATVRVTVRLTGSAKRCYFPSMLLAFDYDGVIADSAEVILRAMVKVQRRYGLGRPPTREDLATMAVATYEALAETIGFPEGLQAEFRDATYRELEEASEEAPFYPGIGDVLSGLAKTHVLVVITAAKSHLVRAELRRHGIIDSFKEILGGDTTLSKRDRLLAVMRDYATRSSSTFMIGDTISDIRYGKQAGVKTVAVLWGFQEKALLVGEAPDHVVDHPSDLLKLFTG
jgi:phosphoglycolate phosphatase